MADNNNRQALSSDEMSMLLPHERGGAQLEQNTLGNELLDEILGGMEPGETEDQVEVTEVSEEEEADATEEVSDDDDESQDEDGEEVSEEEEADESDKDGDEEESDDHREPVAEDAIVFVDEDGKPITAKEAKLGYLRQADYTRKTQATAQERQNAIQARQEALGKVQEVMEALEDVEIVMGQMVGPPPDPALRSKDPGEYAAQVTEWQQQSQVIQAIRQRRAQERQKLEQLQHAQVQDILAQEAQRLMEAIPEWRDPQVQKKELEQIATHFMEAYKYTPEELSQVQDHRAMVIMKKAMLYDQLQQKGQEVLKDPPKADTRKAKPRPKPKGKPLARGEDGRFQRSRQKVLSEASARLSETGNVNDAARAIEAFLGDDLL